jgi:hypothetical protein
MYTPLHPRQRPNIPNPHWYARSFLFSMRSIAPKQDPTVYRTRRQAVDLHTSSIERRLELRMKHRSIDDIIPYRHQDLDWWIAPSRLSSTINSIRNSRPAKVSPTTVQSCEASRISITTLVFFDIDFASLPSIFTIFPFSVQYHSHSLAVSW